MRTTLLTSAAALSAAAVLAVATPANAATTVEHGIPFDTYVFGCTEEIHLSGALLFVGSETSTPPGGYVLTSHFQPQGVTGVGLTSGATYHATGLTRETTVLVPSGGLVDTYVNQFHIVATAGGTTYDVREIAHLTISPTGAVRVSLDHFTSTC